MLQSSFFKIIDNHWRQDLPFVIYKKPNQSKIVAQMQRDSKLYSHFNFSESGFVFGPFINQQEQTVWFPDNKSNFLKIDFQELKNFKNSFSKINSDNAIKKKHISIVDKAIKALKNQTLQKVVISRSESQLIKEQQPLDWFQRIATLYPNTFCYCWYHPKVGMWLGATPETLIQLQKKSFKTMALAGTMPYEGAIDVNWGEKEKEEQQFVVDSVLAALKSVVSSIQVGETSTQKAGSLLHLKTLLQGELKSPDDLETLINVLHPTSAVCGLPKQEAQNFILDNEGYNRKYYTGFLGVFNPKTTTSLFVNLRCMEVFQKTVSIYVGGGITSLSNSEQEWQETVNKSQIMKAVL